METEGLNDRSNDTRDTAVALPVGATGSGTIGNVVNGVFDSDVYSFNAQPGDVFRVTLTPGPGSQLHPAFAVLGPEGSSYVRLRDTDSVSEISREVFITETGTFFVLVDDLRNLSSSPQNVGGADFTYTLRVERVTPVPVGVTLPVTRQAGTIPTGDLVQIFAFEGTAGSQVTAETFARRLVGGSDVDTILVLVDATGASPVVLAQNDDLGDGETDSRVQATLTATGAHAVVLDHYAIVGAKRDYEISIRATSAAGTSAQIQAVRDAATATADGGMTTVSLPVDEAIVTYKKPAVGSDPAGFFVQAEQAGPALFVAVDPTTLNPEPQVGDRVSFTVTMVSLLNSLRTASAIESYSRASGPPFPVSTLVKDLSGATDLVTALDSYESELIRLDAVVTESFGFAGSGHQSARITTAGIPTATSDLRLRVPQSLRENLDLVPTCNVRLAAVPLWRFNQQAQPSAWVKADFDLSGTTCPAPGVLVAVAASATSVEIHFDRNIDPTSVLADGSQFTFTGGLTASAATTNGKVVTVTTSTQTPGSPYTVTVNATPSPLRDNLGAAVDPNDNTALFDGFQAVVGRLVVNEIDYDQTGTDTMEFVEIFNGTDSAVDLTNHWIVLVNGADNKAYSCVELSGSLPAGGYLVWGSSAVSVAPGATVITFPNPDGGTASSQIQNGSPDSVMLFDSSTNTVVDALSYGGSITAASLNTTAPSCSALKTVPGTFNLVEGTPASVVDSTTGSLSRCANGKDTDNAIADWVLASSPTPGAANNCP